MTALRGDPFEFGYAPARDARRVSELAFERGMVASFSLMALLFLAGFLLRGLVPLRSVEVPVIDPPGHQTDNFHVVPPPSKKPPSVPPKPGVLPGMFKIVESDTLVEQAEKSLPAGGDRVGGKNEAGPPARDGEGEDLERTVREPGEPSGADVMPDVAVRFVPEYPEMAREAQVEGTVYLWALVGRDGAVQEVRVLRSIPLLDAAAAGALKRWRFTPALSNGHAVRVWVAVPVRFSLH